MDLVVDVFYSNNKAGTYVQFELPVNCRELSELNAYDKILQRQISQDFEELFEVFAMDFSSESSKQILGTTLFESRPYGQPGPLPIGGLPPY